MVAPVEDLLARLQAVLRSAVDTSRPLLEAAGHDLEISVPSEPILIEADPVRLSQVVANLLNNAAEYTPTGGAIALAVSRDGGDVVIAVRDTGVGIPAEMLPRVFELFTQIDRTRKHSQGGLGIGLALVKSLVEMHGGRVEARLALLLQFSGYDVQTAHDGLSALQAIDDYQPAVALLDIGMPGMDGYEVARRVRERPELKDVVLVALTGWGQEEDRRRSAQAGFDRHLVKPVDPEVLQGLLATVGQPG